MKKSSCVFVVALCLCFALNSAQAKLANLHEVSQGIFRGGEPHSEEDFAELKNLHVKTILSLQDFFLHIHSVRKMANQYGFNFVSVPISALTPRVSEESVQKALDTLTNPADQPVYLHCLLGKDRTGLVAGLYRVHFEHWSKDQAFKEMVGLGFKPVLLHSMYSFFLEHLTPGSLQLKFLPLASSLGAADQALQMPQPQLQGLEGASSASSP